MVLMQKVPLLMREKSNEEYEPKVVSLEPYHHGKEKLKFVEDFKPKAVDMFIGESSREEYVFIYAILMKIGYIRSCYTEESTSKYTDEELARMMLWNDKFEEYYGKKAETTSILSFAVYNTIKRDMFLLENPVPLQILKILVYLRYNTPQEVFIKEIEKYSILMFFSDDNNGRTEATYDEGSDALHLIEIFQRVIARDQDRKKDDDSFGNVDRLLECLECRCNEEKNPDRYEFCSMTNLKSKGIHIRCSKIESLIGARFSPTKLGRFAELKLPPMYLDMYTKVFLKNVIAYELAPHDLSKVDKKVTTYVSFMKQLLVTAEDVKVLRENKIIFDFSGNADDDVVQLYKDLNTYEAEDPGYYWEVKQRLHNHYTSNIMMWMANLKSTYFSNP